MRYSKTHCRLILTALLVCLSPYSLADKKSQSQQQPNAEQRERLEQRRKDFESLPPEEQAKIRKAREKFRKMPDEERRRLKEQWKKMTPEERRRYQKG